MAKDGYLFRTVVAQYCILHTYFVLRNRTMQSGMLVGGQIKREFVRCALHVQCSILMCLQSKAGEWFWRWTPFVCIPDGDSTVDGNRKNNTYRVVE